MAEELAEERAESRQIADQVRQELTRDSPQEETERARRKVPTTILLLFMLLLILLLIAAATGRLDVISIFGQQPPAEPLEPVISSNNQVNLPVAVAQAGGPNAANIPGINSLNTPQPQVANAFREFYDRYGGERIFGRPISDAIEVNGRTIQWFERTRLEMWPEHTGTPYEVQSGRVGVEFTDGIIFPTQAFFVSRPGLRYFPETEHGVGGRFLRFWEENGGLTIFGYPISEEVQELLPDGQIYTVQYFERARLEYHPQHAGTPYEVQIGLLGRGLYLNESKPEIITPVDPTPVPMP